MGKRKNIFFYASTLLYFLIHSSTGHRLSAISPNPSRGRDRDLVIEYNVRIELSMDPAVFFCDDFYTHVCGRAQNDSSLMTLTPNIINRTEWKHIITHQLRDFTDGAITPEDSDVTIKIKRQVAKCKRMEQRNADGIDWLRLKIEMNGHWPMVMDPDSLIPDYFNTLKSQKYESPLFALRVEHNNIYIDRYDLSVYGKFLSNLKFKEKLDFEEHYKVLVEQAVNIYAKDGGQEKLKNLDEQIVQVMNFRRELHNLARFKSKNVKAEMAHTPLTVQALDNLIPTIKRKLLQRRIKWLPFLEGVFQGIDFRVTANTTVYIDKDYIQNLLYLLKSTPVNTIANHIQLHFFESYMGHTSFKFYDLSKQLASAADSEIKHFHESDHCIDFPQIWRGFNYVYLKKWFPDSSRQAVGDMVMRIKSALQEEIDHSLIMDEDAKRTAKAILHGIQVIVGSDQKYMAYPLLASYYNYSTSYYLPMIMNAHKAFKDMEFKSITLNDRSVLSEYPILDDEVSYSVRDLRINIPIGYLHRTNLSPTLKPQLSYATLGQEISLLLNKAILAEGTYPIEFGPKVLESSQHLWYEKPRSTELGNRITCFMRQYKRIADESSRLDPCPIRNVKLPTSIEYSNNDDSWESYLADSMAFQTAFVAYKDLISNSTEIRNANLQYDERDEVFLYAYVNRHCVYGSPDTNTRAMIESNKRRINTMLSNSHVFALLKNCGAFTTMHFEDKCKFWENVWA